MHFTTVFYLLFLVISSGILSGLTTCLLQLGRLYSKGEFKKIGGLFFFQYLLKPLFGNARWEGLFLTLSLSKQILYLTYGILFTYILLRSELNFFNLSFSENPYVSIFLATLLIILLSVVIDSLLKLFATVFPALALRLFSPIASLFLTLFSPFTAVFIWISKSFLQPIANSSKSLISIRDKILEVLYESELSTHLDPQERKLILSVANFKERNVREVMVPRIDVICLSEETSLEEASEIFLKERYSRLPVYQDTIDHVKGMLLYKDVLSAFIHENHEVSIRSLIKPILYTPETKKISQLLQEFRNKQSHLAVVVDEYGGTEGIITIEDILEELVGEIADEDDNDPEVLYSVLPTGGWIVDARMSILDIEKELSIQIPSSSEYDTLGGYIYHRAGSIPTKGWRLHHDDFDLEILSSDQRCIEKVKIIPHLSPLL